MVLKEEHDDNNKNTNKKPTKQQKRRRKKEKRRGQDNYIDRYLKVFFFPVFFFFFFFFFFIMAASQEIEILVSGLRIRSLMGLGAPYLHHRRRGGREGGQSRSVRTAKSGVNGNCWKSQICVIGLLDSWIAACTAGLPYTSACGCYVILLFANFSSKLPLK